MHAEQGELVSSKFIKISKKILDLAKEMDVVVEIVDARIPFSGANLLDYHALGNKKRLIFLTNPHRADAKQTDAWVEFYKNKGIKCQILDSDKLLLEDNQEFLNSDWTGELTKFKNKKILIIGLPDSLRTMVLANLFNLPELVTGIPSNLYWKYKATRFEGVEIMVTPDITPFTPFDQDVYWHTQMLGIFNVDGNEESVAVKIFEFLVKKYKKKLEEGYGLTPKEPMKVNDIVNCLIKIMAITKAIQINEISDLTVACTNFFKDFISGKRIDKVSIEWVSDYEKKSL
ncbi:P-loop NTPase family protein [Spiroplasma chrysopicola]|uniref:Putative ribosome biogenesis GTPase n=1 Tax=Spiroplasma chrysopicola DF-1 TaxID=1276227 RepID=R4UFB2_9MOLU|nr:ribosome biogenesis GTPase [Spiroplasma chrysopicola]AGM24825.1 putative ribosome biogenesis GTPase [Spiroplasma chrysopicola DF-1]